MKAFLLAGAMLALAHAACARSPVCSGAGILGDNGYFPGNNDISYRGVYYCPQGLNGPIQLQFFGTYVFPGGNSVVELPTGNIGMTISIETFVPPPWAEGVTYPAGFSVTPRPVVANPGMYVTSLLPTASWPTPGQFWRASSGDSSLMRVTCSGHVDCLVPSSGFLITDPSAPVIQPPGSFIAVREHLHGSGFAAGPVQSSRMGSYLVQGMVDYTAGGAPVSNYGALNLGPYAITGTQDVAAARNSVCLLGDSVSVGFGGAGVGGVTIVDGGHGYAATDVGKIVRNVDANASPGDGLVPATYVIKAAAGGQVTSVGMWMPGHYAPPSVWSPIEPSGVQQTTPVDQTNGSGLTVTINGFSGGEGLDEDAATLVEGGLQTGFAHAGLPTASFARSSDAAQGWTHGGSAQRVAAIRKSDCSIAVIALGRNDVYAGLSAAQVEQDIREVAQLMFSPTLQKVYIATMPPVTTSGNHWVDAAGQGFLPAKPVWDQVNAWIRTVPIPFAGMIDVAAAVGDPSGRWLTNGTPYDPTLDGYHEAPDTAAREVDAILAAVARLGL